MFIKADTWYAIEVKDKVDGETYIGYVDENGVEKIEIKLHNYCTRAKEFDYIIAVNEVNKTSQKASFYYLTKSGKRVKENMAYMTDHTCDCENEGYIRFADNKNDLVGMLDKEGDTAIPTEYDCLSKVFNGLAIGTKGGYKCLHSSCDRQEHVPANRFSLRKQRTYLLNTLGKVLVKNFDDTDIDLYSAQRTLYKPILKKYQRTFLGVDDMYYTFDLYEKKFRDWMENNIFLNFSKQTLLAYTKERVILDSEEGRIEMTKDIFIEKYFNKIQDRLLKIKTKRVDYFLSSRDSSDGLNESKQYQKYFDNCESIKNNEYPCFSFIIGDLDNREYITYLKDGEKYYIVSVMFQ